MSGYSRPADGPYARYATDDAPDLTSTPEPNVPPGTDILAALCASIRRAHHAREIAARNASHDCDTAGCGYYCDYSAEDTAPPL